MKATGIVRRIDDLGRIVIPKEIRRTMRIKEGDPLEIFVNGEGEIILKKYSPIEGIADFAKEYADALSESSGQTVFICDRDNIIAAGGVSRKNYLGKPIGSLAERSMEERRSFLEKQPHIKEGGIIAGNADNTQFYAYLITPIVVQGDPVGAIIICSKNEDADFGKTERVLTETAAGFFARQMTQ
jgi:AbrB family transcriptional regulator (stage V sporulation protein T)